MLFLILVFCLEELFFQYNWPQAKIFKKKAKKPAKQVMPVMMDTPSSRRMSQCCRGWWWSMRLVDGPWMMSPECNVCLNTKIAKECRRIWRKCYQQGRQRPCPSSSSSRQGALLTWLNFLAWWAEVPATWMMDGTSMCGNRDCKQRRRWDVWTQISWLCALRVVLCRACRTSPRTANEWTSHNIRRMWDGGVVPSRCRETNTTGSRLPDWIFSDQWSMATSGDEAVRQ